MIYIGIDPGKEGAVALLHDEDGRVEFHDVPMSTEREYLPALMAAILTRYEDWSMTAVLEKVNAMPALPGADGKRARMGATSAFSFGRGAGLWEGMLAALGIPYHLVPPQRWKKALMDGMPKEKDASRVRAMQMFPGAAGDLKRKKDHGRADALLLAEYARRLSAGNGASAA